MHAIQMRLKSVSKRVIMQELKIHDEDRLKVSMRKYRKLGEDNQLVLQTFEKAFEKTKDVTGLIVHSDQGFQYTSYTYHDMLPKVGAQISMSRRGNCYDNASMDGELPPAEKIKKADAC
ncbi:hypothetical protein AB432_017435 [Brevibacillus brevis]|uniref:Integrase catalytic domain-containing protein n=1 Tax=Brevibacillus brevis TaxID=1393 RepID=A0A2Z4MJS5_BREBE|nr:hypothetical protein AB432_017435 [Brevibacillus brevis]